MKWVNKRIVTDENNRPIAVQIPYEERLGIEELLKADRPEGAGAPLIAAAMGGGSMIGDSCVGCIAV